MYRTNQGAEVASFCSIEQLESRQLLSVSLSGGTLVINEGKSWDLVTVARAGKTGLNVTVNGTTTSYLASAVKRIRINTARGDDVIRVGSSDRPIDLSCVIVGGPGNDTIWSGHGNDSITGDAGNDEVRSLGGNDTLKGGDGNDTLASGDDDDKVYGEAGDDLLLGGAGKDRIEGGIGDDVIHDGFGKDTVYGHAGADVFYVADARKEFVDMTNYEARFGEDDGYGIELD